MLLDATSDTNPRCRTIPGITESSGDIGDIKRWFINLSLHGLRKLCEDNTCGYIKLEQNNYRMSSKSSSSYFITRKVIIGLVQKRVRNVTSW